MKNIKKLLILFDRKYRKTENFLKIQKRFQKIQKIFRKFRKSFRKFRNFLKKIQKIFRKFRKSFRKFRKIQENQQLYCFELNIIVKTILLVPFILEKFKTVL